MPFLVFLVFLFYISEAGHAPTWDSCNCYWETWKAWSQCSASCGGGYRYRSRRVWHDDVPRCDGFEKCASSDMGSDYDYSCNAICYHGSYSDRSCRCPAGWYGRCCNNQITCGNPGSLRHGYVEGSLYTYNSVVIYHCDNFYNLTGGTRTSRCQLNTLWSGVKPRCAFANSCQSNPCQNNGTCLNGLDRYRCECTRSFTGKNCEIDIEAPEMEGCPKNITKFSSEAMTFLNWTAPTFTDPVGKPIEISTNYPRDSYTFPWGDFDVQYVALKPSNGMRTSCVFSLKIRPHPCKTLENPSNGAKVCNGWKTDYGEFCLAFCGNEYSLDITSSYLQWYVCGARGRWVPHQAMSNCTGTFITDKTNDARFRFTNCSAPDQVEKIQETYLTMLKTSPYGYFCTKFEGLCHKDNVIVSCL